MDSNKSLDPYCITFATWPLLSSYATLFFFFKYFKCLNIFISRWISYTIWNDFIWLHMGFYSKIIITICSCYFKKMIVSGTFNIIYEYFLFSNFLNSFFENILHPFINQTLYIYIYIYIYIRMYTLMYCKIKLKLNC